VTPELRREVLADHARRRSGRREEPSGGDWQEATLKSPTCGDELTIRIRTAAGSIAALEWRGLGCEVSQASASMMAELAPGTAVADLPALVARLDGLVHGPLDAHIEDLGDASALAGVGRFPVRGRCAMLAWRALLAAAGTGATEA
jgi:nitrogen fixation NifU-like protein